MVQGVPITTGSTYGEVSMFEYLERKRKQQEKCKLRTFIDGQVSEAK